MLLKKSIQAFNELKEKWNTWSLPTKIGLASTLVFGVIGFVGTVLTIYSILYPIVPDLHFQESRQEGFNQHLRDIDSVVSELNANRRILDLYYDNNQNYLKYNYRYTQRFSYVALESLINSHSIRFP